jgi:hypothetical protein
LQLQRGRNLIRQVLRRGLFFLREVSGPARVGHFKHTQHVVLREQRHEHRRSRETRGFTRVQERTAARLRNIQESAIAQAHNCAPRQPFGFRVERHRHGLGLGRGGHPLERFGSSIIQIQTNAGRLRNSGQHVHKFFGNLDG